MIVEFKIKPIAGSLIFAAFNGIATIIWKNNGKEYRNSLFRQLQKAGKLPTHIVKVIVKKEPSPYNEPTFRNTFIQWMNPRGGFIVRRLLIYFLNTRYTAATKSKQANAWFHLNDSPLKAIALKATNTTSVITSCITFNCIRLNGPPFSLNPIRFAGTWKQYSLN